MNSFIGQTRIIKELEAIRDSLLADENLNVNILLRGPGGCGKTHLAKEFARNFGPFSIQWPAQGFRWDKKCEEERTHIVDEIHLLKIPEPMFRYLDEEKYIFILTTTEGGSLVEPLTSRCIQFNFSSYSLNEIATIIINHAVIRDFPITKSTALIIAERAKGSPRIAKQYLDRISFMINQKYHPFTLSGIKAAFDDVGIFNGGYTELDIRYLKILSQQVTASLHTLATAIRVDKATITNDIEPFLISKGHINITGRGRKFVSWKGKDYDYKSV